MNARIAAPLLTLAVTLALPAFADDAWLHLRVEKTGDDAETVLINVPLEVAAKVLANVDNDHLRQGKVVLDREDRADFDFAAMWKAVREAPDADFVTVRSRDENVRIAKEKGYLLVLADEGAEEASGRETVRIRIPLAVADAMFGDDAANGELDIIAALRELGRTGNGELMTVDDGEETVRIWIDSQKDAR